MFGKMLTIDLTTQTIEASWSSGGKDWVGRADGLKELESGCRSRDVKIPSFRYLQKPQSCQ
jgi:hypothetical protein